MCYAVLNKLLFFTILYSQTISLLAIIVLIAIILTFFCDRY